MADTIHEDEEYQNYLKERQEKNAIMLSKYSAQVGKAMEAHRISEKQAKTGLVPDITRTLVNEDRGGERVIIMLYGPGGASCGRFVFIRTAKTNKLVLRKEKPEAVWMPGPAEAPEPLEPEQIAISQYLESVGFEKRKGKFMTHFEKGGGARFDVGPDIHQFSHSMRIDVLHHLFYSARIKYFSLVVRHDEAKGEPGGGCRRYSTMTVPKCIRTVDQAKYLVEFFTEK